MVLNLIKIVLFLIVNAVGFYTIPVIINLAVKLGRLPDVATARPEYFETYQFLLLGMAIPVWAVAALISIGYFFASREIRTWLLLAPIYVPALYGTGIITYFHFV